MKYFKAQIIINHFKIFLIKILKWKKKIFKTFSQIYFRTYKFILNS
jgi:hypothetical protein